MMKGEATVTSYSLSFPLLRVIIISHSSFVSIGLSTANERENNLQ